MSMWDNLFSQMRQPVAQILLTRNDIADRTQYLNAEHTFIELLNMGVIPIVNENDTLSVQEIKFGDNDTLSAITAAMVQADYLFLMTDVDCLYDKNPRTNPDAKAIEVVDDISELAADVSTMGWGRPHMWAGTRLSPGFMLVHGPRDDDELATVRGIVAASHAYASGSAPR